MLTSFFAPKGDVSRAVKFMCSIHQEELFGDYASRFPHVPPKGTTVFFQSEHFLAAEAKARYLESFEYLKDGERHNWQAITFALNNPPGVSQATEGFKVSRGILFNQPATCQYRLNAWVDIPTLRALDTWNKSQHPKLQYSFYNPDLWKNQQQSFLELHYPIQLSFVDFPSMQQLEKLERHLMGSANALVNRRHSFHPVLCPDFGCDVTVDYHELLTLPTIQTKRLGPIITEFLKQTQNLPGNWKTVKDESNYARISTIKRFLAQHNLNLNFSGLGFSLEETKA